MNYYINKYKHTNATKLRMLNDKCPKKYWKFLNNLKPKSAGSTSPDITELYEHFRNINTCDYDQSNNYDFVHHDANQLHDNEYLNGPISEYEINKCIMNLKNAKAPSPTDDIINEYIKTTKHILLPIYCKLFNCILETGFYTKKLA